MDFHKQFDRQFKLTQYFIYAVGAIILLGWLIAGAIGIFAAKNIHSGITPCHTSGGSVLRCTVEYLWH